MFSRPNTAIMIEGMSYFYSTDEYTPSLLFSYYNGHSAAAASNNYEFVILDQKGKILKRVKRDTPEERFDSSEKEYLARQIREIKDWPNHVKRKLIDRIPKYKNYLNRILLSDKHIYIFRVKEDVSDEDSDVPVDIFSLSGSFLGNIKMEKTPLFISGSFMYFKVESDSDDLILEKYKYQLK